MPRQIRDRCPHLTLGPHRPAVDRRRHRCARAASVRTAADKTSELLTVREVLLADPSAAADLLRHVLRREPPDAAVQALADYLEPLAAQGVAVFTDVELRIWFLGWTLYDAD